MTIDQLKNEVTTGVQHYYSKEQVLRLLDKLNTKPNESKGKGMATVLELF